MEVCCSGVRLFYDLKEDRRKNIDLEALTLELQISPDPDFYNHIDIFIFFAEK